MSHSENIVRRAREAAGSRPAVPAGKRVDTTRALAGGNRKRRYERAVRERDEHRAVQRFCAVTGLSADVLEESGAAAYKAFRAGKLTGKQALLLGVSPAAVRKQEHAR